MIKHGDVKLGSRVELNYNGMKGKIFVFDSFNTVGVEWDNGNSEYMVYMTDLNLIGGQVSKLCFCGAKYNGINCNSCGFDASEIDIY